MFQSYRNIITDATQSEVKLTQKYNQQKEQVALEIKEALETESKKITQGQLLKSYSPIEISNKITSLQIKHKNTVTEHNNALNNIHEETDKKLFHEMKYKIKLPITEIYKDIYCHYNNVNVSNQWSFHVCRVWFSLIENNSLNLKPGDPFKVAWFDLSDSITQPKADNMVYKITSDRSKNELQIPNFLNAYEITEPKKLYNINHWGETSKQKNYWLNWIRKNRPIPE